MVQVETQRLMATVQRQAMEQRTMEILEQRQTVVTVHHLHHQEMEVLVVLERPLIQDQDLQVEVILQLQNQHRHLNQLQSQRQHRSKSGA